jgi:hypothetical protein
MSTKDRQEEGQERAKDEPNEMPIEHPHHYYYA